MWSLFEISDGTLENTISLLDPHGLILEEARRALPALKSGGIWQESILVEGRQPIMAEYGNVQQAIRLKVAGADQDVIAAKLEQLFKLLLRAREYWTSKRYSSPVYLHVRGATESQDLYALIYDWNLPELSDPHRAPFFNAGNFSSTDELTLTLEHSQWRDTKPGDDGTATPAGHSFDYDGRTYGTVNQYLELVGTTEPLWIASKNVENNLTDMYYYDASGPTWSGNLLDAPLPITLMPAAVAVGDMLYVGIDSTLADSSPFSSLILNLSQAASLNYTLEYWDGAAWTAINYVDESSGGLLSGGTGRRFVAFYQPYNWATGNLLTILGGAAPNITGWWVRLRVTAITTTTPPIQQDYLPYTANRPYIQIKAGDLPGVLDSLIHLAITERYSAASMNPYSTIDPRRYLSRIFMAARSISRGENFTPFINLQDRCNPSGISVSFGTSVSSGSFPSSPTGELTTWAPTHTEDYGDRICVELDSTISAEYTGAFRVFLRADVVIGSRSDFGFEVVVALYSGLNTPVENRAELDHTKQVVPPTTTPYNTGSASATIVYPLIDLGVIRIPEEEIANHRPNKLVFIVRSKGGNFTNTNFVDLILMPVDEWSADTSDPYLTNGSSALIGNTVHIDGIRPIKQTATAILDDSSGNEIAKWQMISNGTPRISPQGDMRIFFLLADYLYLRATHTTTNNSPDLIDSAENFTEKGVPLGTRIVNVTDQSSGNAELVTTNQIDTTLTSGVDSDWDIGDVYSIVTPLSIGDHFLFSEITLKAIGRYLGLRGAD